MGRTPLQEIGNLGIKKAPQPAPCAPLCDGHRDGALKEAPAKKAPQPAPCAPLCDGHAAPSKLVNATKVGQNGYSKCYYICAHACPCDFFATADSVASDVSAAGTVPAKEKTQGTSDLSDSFAQLALGPSAPRSNKVEPNSAICQPIRIPKKGGDAAKSAPVFFPTDENRRINPNKPASLNTILDAAGRASLPANPLRWNDDMSTRRPAFSTERLAMLDKCKLRSCYNNLWRDPVAKFDAPPGLKVDLFPHQSISVSWMIEDYPAHQPYPCGKVLRGILRCGAAATLATPPCSASAQRA